MMRRTTVDGKTVNQRTADMLALWQFNALTDFYVVQGSYNAGGVAASAGTHDGGGALDLSVYGWTDAFTTWVVKQGRLAGFAAWYRNTIPGLWNEHIHAIAMGDPEASAGARAQVVEYSRGGDGLKGSVPDGGPKVPVVLYPHTPLKKVSMLVVYRQFRLKNPTPHMAVKRVQWVLNEKLGINLPVDGVAGPKTRAAYASWERRLNGKKSDGLPGRKTLKALGKGRFEVSVAGFEKWIDSIHDKKKQAAREAEVPTFPKK